MNPEASPDVSIGAAVSIDPISHPWAWRGAVEWHADGNRFQPWRIPPTEFHSFDAPLLVERARMAAGVRFEVETDAEEIEAEFSGVDGHTGPIDLLVDGSLLVRIPVAGSTTIRHALPIGVRRVELWLPQFGGVVVGEVRLFGASRVAPVPTGLRWAAYGSSITQCRMADGPSRTWPALVDRSLGWSHTNLGFDGQSHLDPPARRTIASVDAQLLLVCVGINIYEAATFGHRGLAPQVGGFLVDLMASHPDVPVVLVSPIPSPTREDRKNSAGLTLASVRSTIEEVGQALSSGPEQCSWISGPELLRVDEADRLLPDGLHPGQEGMQIIAERLSSRLADISAQRDPTHGIPRSNSDRRSDRDVRE